MANKKFGVHRPNQQRRPGTGAFSPIDYVRTRVRQLPVHECLMLGGEGLYNIIVSRLHPQGKISYASFLVDVWCAGMRDSLWQVCADEVEYTRFKQNLFGGEPKQISYEEAHNWIYGAIAWAGDAGIEPGMGWEYSQYLLEEDTEEIPLIENEYGDEGKYHLVMRNATDADRYLPLLERNLESDQYKVSSR